MEFDKSIFILRIAINASTDRLFDAWTTRAGMEYWFLRFCQFTTDNGTVLSPETKVQVGDRYAWRWHGYSDADTETGTILEMNKKDTIKYSFGKAGNVKIVIQPDGDGSMVELIQDNIPLDENGLQYYHIGCKCGWTFHLTNMKSLFEGGIDLRNRRLDLTGVINS